MTDIIEKMEVEEKDPNNLKYKKVKSLLTVTVELDLELIFKRKLSKRDIEKLEKKLQLSITNSLDLNIDNIDNDKIKDIEEIGQEITGHTFEIDYTDINP